MAGGLNIWIINHYAGNLVYGMEYRHFFLARHLTRLGHRPRIISSSFHHLFTKPPEVSGRLTFEAHEGVPFCFIKVPEYKGNGLDRLINTLSFSWRLNRNLKALEKEFGKPDVVLGSSPHPFVQFNLEKIKKVYGAKTLFEVRDLWPQMLIELGSLSPGHPLARLFAWVEERAYRTSDRVVSLWHSANEYMFEHGLDADRYVYLPNGIELPEDGSEIAADYDHPLIEAVRARKAAGKFLVGYGGSHGYANPLQCIVDACDVLRGRGRDDIEFFMVGDGPMKAEIVTNAEALDLPNLHFNGYVDKDVIMAFYNELDVAFMGLRDLPLFKYGPTPNKLMDYLAVGKPIIYAINSSFNPVRDVGAGLTIEPDSAEQLADAMVAMCETPAEELARMGAAGKQYALEELNFKSLAQKLANVCSDCVGEGTLED